MLKEQSDADSWGWIDGAGDYHPGAYTGTTNAERQAWNALYLETQRNLIVASTLMMDEKRYLEPDLTETAEEDHPNRISHQ